MLLSTDKYAVGLQNRVHLLALCVSVSSFQGWQITFT